jgi:hypothetical protein
VQIFNFLFWLLALQEVILGCYKISIIFLLLVGFCPCIVVIVVMRNRRNAQGRYLDGDNVSLRSKLGEKRLQRILKGLFFKNRVVF